MFKQILNADASNIYLRDVNADLVDTPERYMLILTPNARRDLGDNPTVDIHIDDTTNPVTVALKPGQANAFAIDPAAGGIAPPPELLDLLLDGNYLHHTDNEDDLAAEVYQVLPDKSVSENKTFKFAVVADPRYNYTSFTNALSFIDTLEPSVVLATGDLDDASRNLDIVNTTLSNGVLFSPSIGNHDMEDEALHRDLLVEHAKTIPGVVMRDGQAGDYYFDVGTVRFVTIDPYTVLGTDGVINDIGRSWCEYAIASIPPKIKHVFVSIHEPAFPRHRHLDDSFNADPVLRDAFWNMLVRYKSVVRALFVGHTHGYSRIQVLDPASDAANDPLQFPTDEGGVFQIDSGAAGHGDYNTFVLVEITDKMVACVAYTAANGVDESFGEFDRFVIPQPE